MLTAMRTPIPSWIGACLGVALSTASADALATDCDPASGISTCFDADNVWFHATGRFIGVAGAEIPDEGALALGVLASYVDRPVLLRAPSPDPEGRDIAVVRDALGLTLAYEFGLTDRLTIGAATPMVLYQRGAGAEGATSQSAPPLGSTAVRDPRASVGYLFAGAGRAARFRSLARLELALPLGDSQLFAGSGGFTLAPSVAFSARQGAFYGTGEMGARIRRSAAFATARLGSALHTGVGVGVEVLGELLAFELEGYLLPVLSEQPGRENKTSSTRDGVLVPAEWALSACSTPVADLAVFLGGGTGLALSSETRESASEAKSESFAGVTTPRFRLFAGVRYAPAATAPRR